jgi:hypothetical protein
LSHCQVGQKHIYGHFSIWKYVDIVNWQFSKNKHEISDRCPSFPLWDDVREHKVPNLLLQHSWVCGTKTIYPSNPQQDDFTWFNTDNSILEQYPDDSVGHESRTHFGEGVVAVFLMSCEEPVWFSGCCRQSLQNQGNVSACFSVILHPKSPAVASPGKPSKIQAPGARWEIWTLLPLCPRCAFFKCPWRLLQVWMWRDEAGNLLRAQL